MRSIFKTIILFAIILSILWYLGYFKVYKQPIYCIKAPCPEPVWMINFFSWQYQVTKIQPAENITFTQSEISIAGNQILSIDDFPDSIKVSAGAEFGSSDRILNAMLSPSGDWVAIAVGGAAHDFGWVYKISTKKLTPVIFSYGGGVDIKSWNNDHMVTFIVTSPRPDTTEKSIDVDNLPEYPL